MTGPSEDATLAFRAKQELVPPAIRSPNSRFHHRIVAPAGSLGGKYNVSAEIEDDLFPRQLWYQRWILSQIPQGQALCGATVVEYRSIASAQRAMSLRMHTMAIMIDRTPVTSGPGDIRIDIAMARDNVEVLGATPDFDQNRIQTGLGAVDAYLLSNWPLAAAEHSGVAMEPLEVEVSVAKQVKREEETELRLTVKQRGQRLPLDGLSFRVLMEPGRLRWDDGRLMYWSSQAGPATITADVFVEPSAYGQGVARLDVND